ncbi:MAG: hypoxanthine-guanine phosphoribosyltransferase [Pseudomonadota bacterium]|jgi:hypoxanthine phosphoribosyltransferase|nr:hypoxanthine-guanine phosphoribosyltransferase [Pseudomonadota bacterium]|tara:strand:+ start:886 stop:1449 length:564 start_codon:yes stop_codon:yes gene_type:complete
MADQKESIKECQKVLKEAELLYTTSEINEVIDDISVAITSELEKTNPIIIPIMIGGLIMAGQLIPKLNFPLQIDYAHATRYAGGVHGGKLTWLKKPDKSLIGRTILLVDDILDEGVTLSEIIKYCYSNGAKNVLTAVLVQKVLGNKEFNQNIDFVGVSVPNVYVFGYGMDYCEYHRNAAGIYAVRKS